MGGADFSSKRGGGGGGGGGGNHLLSITITKLALEYWPIYRWLEMLFHSH